MSAAVRPASAAPLLYELQPTRPLPCIDNAKCVKHVLLSPRALRVFNRFTYVAGKFLGLSFLSGLVLSGASIMAPSSSSGVVLVVLSVSFQLAPICTALLVLRFDMVVLLTKTYEFWYLTLTNVSVCTLVSLSLADARWLVVFCVGLAFQLALLIDANVRATKAAIWATSLGALLNMSYVFCSMFGYVHNLEELTLFRYKRRKLQADDALLNVLGTLWVLMVRNAYRKHQFSRTTVKPSPYTERVTCIMYRCRLAVRPVSASTSTLQQCRSSPPLLAVAVASSVSSTSPPARSTIQLEFARVQHHFSEANVLFPSVARLLPPPPRWLQVGVCMVSLASIVAALLSPQSSAALAGSILSLCVALTVFTSYLCYAQRELLTRQVSSFDFAFFSVQLFIIHGCLADIVGWFTPRSLLVLSSWVWIHWVLLVDTVLPIHKTTRLGYGRNLPIVVLALFVVQQIAVFIVLVFYGDSTDPRLALRDRELFEVSLNGRARQVRVVPMLFGRMVTALSWSFRLLWRLWRSAPTADELLLMQGRVQFESPSGKPRETQGTHHQVPRLISVQESSNTPTSR